MRWKIFGVLFFVGCGGGVSLGQSGQGQSGTDGGTGDDGSSGGSGTGVKECASTSDCGPMPAMPATKCPDGTVAGYTGRCIQQGAACVWENKPCPPPPTMSCFQNGELVEPYKDCKQAADCTTEEYSLSCCGSPRVTGVAVSYDAAVKSCIAALPPQPACACPSAPPTADDGSQATTVNAKASVYCDPSNHCVSTFKQGVACGTTTCNPGETCCSGVPYPSPTCTTGVCAISRRAYKKDISYVDDEERQRLTDELYGFRLATYRYRQEAASSPTHLGFMIDDVAPSAAVTQKSGDSVDLYGYTTMAVAALQTQAREIAELRREVDDLKKSCKR